MTSSALSADPAWLKQDQGSPAPRPRPSLKKLYSCSDGRLRSRASEVGEAICEGPRHELGEQRMSDALERFYSERDELLKWLQTLERDNAPLEAILEVRRELERVLHDIRRLKGGTT